MASEEVVTLPFDATLRPRIIGKQGKNVRSLSEHFKVRLAFNAAGDSVDIVGENRVAAAKAIESLLRGEQLQTALKASSTPNIKTPLETTPTQCQIVHTPTYFFLKFRLWTEITMYDESAIKNWIDNQLLSLGGVVGGGSLDVDVLSVNLEERSFLVRTSSDAVSLLHASLAMANSFLNKPCAIELMCRSTSLIAMAAPSRTLSLADFSKADE